MYIDVNNVTLFYTKIGVGEPIILLHGNGENHTIFDKLAQTLSQNFTVYSIDSRCHGSSTNNKDTPITYKLMRDDIYFFIQKLNIASPTVIGFSDGGIVSLLLSIEYPNLLNKCIAIGANTSPSGITKSNFLSMKIIYFFTRKKLFKFMLTEPNITDEELQSIITPTLILTGEKDVIKKSHTEYIHKNIPNSTLKIVKNGTHGNYVLDNNWLYNEIKDFI